MLGLFLSSIFWLPALLEQEYVNGLKIYNVEDNFPEIYQLIFPSWGTGFSSSSLENQMSFQIGVTNLLGVLLSFIALIIYIKKRDKKKISAIVFFLISFIVVTLLITKISQPIWRTIPFLNYFQFPWRLLSLEILITSFLAGGIFFRQFKLLAFFMITLAFLITYNYTKPAYFHQRNDDYYISRSNFIDGTNSVGNYFNTIWFDKNLKKQKNILEIKPEIKIISKNIGIQKYQFILFSEKKEQIILNIAYFPGWIISSNGKEENATYTVDGRIRFNVPKGKTDIEIIFLDTIIRKISVLLSSLAFLILIITFVKGLKKNYDK